MKAIHTRLNEMRVACTSSRVRSVHCPEPQCIWLLCPEASDRLTRRVYAGAPGPLLAMCTHRPTSEEPRASSRNVPVETTNH